MLSEFYRSICALVSHEPRVSEDGEAHKAAQIGYPGETQITQMERWGLRHFQFMLCDDLTSPGTCCPRVGDLCVFDEDLSLPSCGIPWDSHTRSPLPPRWVPAVSVQQQASLSLRGKRNSRWHEPQDCPVVYGAPGHGSVLQEPPLCRFCTVRS